MISLVFTMCISYKGIMNNLDSSQQTAFVTRYQTADGYITVIGGLCPEHLLCTCQKAFSQLEQYNLGASADCVMIDASLSRLLLFMFLTQQNHAVALRVILHLMKNPLPEYLPSSTATYLDLPFQVPVP